MDRIRELEVRLLKAEAAIAVVLVLVMLALASYNVFYRNVLVQLQKHWAHSGPPVAASTVAPPEPEAQPQPRAIEPSQDDAAPDKSGAEGFAGDFGDEPSDKSGAEGFAGDFGDEPEPAAKKEEPAPKKAEGFAGDFGDEPEPEPEPKKAEGFAGDFGDEPDPKAGAGEGFAGDFGDEADAKAKPDDEDLSFESEGEELDDQFASLPKVDAVVEADADAALGGPPPEGSFAAWAVAFIDDIKLDWIDVFLRQLVIITSFFGAMLATQRKKHINIDALSKLLPARSQRWVSAMVNALAIGVCLVLANAGWDLVQIGRQYPKELLPWAEEWTFQLMFPVGFGLLALHFLVRFFEALTDPEPVSTEGGKA